MSDAEKIVTRTNWAGNLVYGTDQLHQAETVAEVQDIVKSSSRIRPLGSRHCFNAIADSSECQISVQSLNRIIYLDETLRRVTVEAGVRYGDLCPYLNERGYALHNLASLPHISIVGACATATHGSGVTSSNLAAAVTDLELINANGDLVTFSREGDAVKFAGAVVSLGALGVVTRITLEVEPAFDMTQHVYLDLPMAALDDHFDEIVSGGYSVSLFTDWQSDAVNQVWIKRKTATEQPVGPEPAFYGALPATTNVHPIPGLAAVHCTQQMGVPGPWFERLPHFRMEFTPSSGKELQSEYFVPREYSMQAIQAIHKLRDRVSPLLLVSEIRTIDADDLWMSPCYHRPSTGFHFTWKQEWDAVQELLPMIERVLDPFEVRPHWGKLFTMSPRGIQSQYQRLSEFQALAHEHDPRGKFRNAFLDDHVFGG